MPRQPPPLLNTANPLTSMKTTFLSISLALFFAVTAFAQDYQIQIHRPMKVGDRYHIQETLSQSQSLLVTANGTPIKNDAVDFSADYQSVEQVLAVDNIGRETKTSCTIGKLTKTQAGATTDLLPAGTVVVSFRTPDNKQVHQVDGKDVDPVVGKILDTLIGITKGGPSDDEVFGTNQRQKVGGTWDLNAENAIKSLGDSMDGQMQDLSGKVTLLGVTKENGGDVLNISAKATGKMVPQLPPAFTVDSSSFDLTFGGNYPVNIDLGRPKDTVSMVYSLSGHATSPSGDNVVLQAKMTLSIVHQQSRL